MSVEIAFNDSPCSALTWLDYPVLPAGCVTVFAGPGGVGKSSLVRSLAAALTRAIPVMGRVGAHWAGIDVGPDHPIRLLYIATEESWSSIARPHLIVEGADMDRVHCIKGVYVTDDKGEKHLDSLATLHNLDPVLADLERRFPQERLLLVVDPWGDYSGMAGLDLNDNTEQRQAMDRFRTLTDRGHTVWLIHHVGKRTGQLRDRTIGSVAIVDKARLQFVVARDPDTGSREANAVVISSVKVNVPGYEQGSWGCHAESPPDDLIEKVRGEMQSQGGISPRDITRAVQGLYVVAWDGPCDRSADEVATEASAPPSRTQEERPRQTVETLEAWVLGLKAGVTGSEVRSHNRFSREHFGNAENAELWLEELVQQGKGYWRSPPPPVKEDGSRKRGRTPVRRFIPGREEGTEQGNLPGIGPASGGLP